MEKGMKGGLHIPYSPKKVTGDSSIQYLLDLYPQCFTSFSLRKLFRLQKYAIRVVRSLDGAFLDIGFNFDGSLDTNRLLNFAGSGDAGISIAYGNGINLVQTNTATQPKIVIGGVLQVLGGKPAASFSGSSLSSFNPITQKITMFNVCRQQHLYTYGDTASRGGGYYANGANRSFLLGGIKFMDDGVITGSQELITIYNLASGSPQNFMQVNTVNQTISSPTGLPTIPANTTEGLRIVGLNSTSLVQEALFFTEHNYNVAAISANINAWYNIY